MRKCLDCDKDLVDAKGSKKRCDICNKTHRKLYWREREKDPQRKEQNKKRLQKFYQNNPNARSSYNKKYRPRINQWKKLKYDNDIQYKLSNNLRDRLYHAIATNVKSAHTLDLLGCSVEELKIHLESQFKQGMTWQNWSLNGWHIDHIRPISSFDLSDPIQQQQCFHYTNLQPLWAKDNLSKGDKII